MHRNAKKSKHGLAKNQKLDNARRLRCIFFIEPDDEESKRIMKMLVESWKFRCQQQCLADLTVISTGKPVALLEDTRQNTLVLLKLTNK